MKKSKLTALLLAAVMSVGMFTACGKGDESASDAADAADAKTIRDITSMELIGEMKTGWNLGNTLDSTITNPTGSETPTDWETAWGQPVTTKAMIDSYVALDIETTGLNPAADRIIEIGMARVCNGNVTDTYSTLVNPGIKISDRIIELTHIHNEELTDKPRINELIEDVIQFIGDYPILGHNVIFDYSFLKKAAVNNNLVFPSAGIDTLKMARRILPELEHKKLDYLCEYLKIDPGNSHRALDDALSASGIYWKMYTIKPDDSGFEIPSELVYSVEIFSISRHAK